MGVPTECSKKHHTCRLLGRKYRAGFFVRHKDKKTVSIIVQHIKQVPPQTTNICIFILISPSNAGDTSKYFEEFYEIEKIPLIAYFCKSRFFLEV